MNKKQFEYLNREIALYFGILLINLLGINYLLQKDKYLLIISGIKKGNHLFFIIVSIITHHLAKLRITSHIFLIILQNNILILSHIYIQDLILR